MVFCFYENNIASKYLRQIIKKHDISQNHLKPIEYQHFDFSGLTQGSPNTSKNTPRASQDHPRTLPENNLRFWCPLGPPQVPPRTSKDLPRDPQGSPRTSLGTSSDLPGTSKDPPGPSQRPPRTPLRTPNDLLRPHIHVLTHNIARELDV